jgi:hypothetical protein
VLIHSSIRRIRRSIKVIPAPPRPAPDLVPKYEPCWLAFRVLVRWPCSDGVGSAWPRGCPLIVSYRIPFRQQSPGQRVPALLLMRDATTTVSTSMSAIGTFSDIAHVANAVAIGH